MRLDWNDIKARAAQFSADWADAHYERGETQSFYNAFFEVFGVSRRRVASFEHGVALPESRRGFLDLFWKGKLLVEQKSAGRDLGAARRQALAYFPGLKDHELPRYILLSDFQSFELYDLDIAPDAPTRFLLKDLADHVQAFGFIVGQETRIFRDQDPVNILASNLMAALHDALNDAGYRGHKLERFLVRLLFCLFADDTGIFQPLGAMETFIAERTREDGGDVGPLLTQLFEVLNTPEAERQSTLDADFKAFPYINGDLFTEPLPLPAFNRDMREKLLMACSFNWEKVSPAIFGSLFQSVLDKAERRKKGAHYTSEKNILKLIEPLFMDELRTEFARLKARRDNGRRKALETFHERLAGLTFFDPACGCGNFLVIAYRELRALETELLAELYPVAQLVTDIGLIAKVNVNQFYGIEITEFPARIAEVALWMMDHIMNARLSATFGQSYLRIPLKTSPNILNADALETNWADVLAPERCSYVLGNPPFSGQSFQSSEQRQQMVRVIGAKSKRGGSLDYVCAWFLKAGDYARSGSSSPLSLRAQRTNPEGSGGSGLLRSARNDSEGDKVLTAADAPAPRIAFVATNSITQGEQVAQLWPLLFERFGLEIAFAHRTFEWDSEASGKAHVHCVILGLIRREDEPPLKRLFSYASIKGEPEETQHAALSPYLFDASTLQNRHLVVKETSKPLANAPQPRMGSKLVDGGHLIFDEVSRARLLTKEPRADSYLCPLMGSEEYINGGKRWILSLENVAPNVLRTMPLVVERLVAVKTYRLKSKKAKTRELADYPSRFEVTTIPDSKYLAIPKVSSERRDYVPIGWLEPPTIPSDLLFVVNDATPLDFAFITSRMHMAWLRFIGGRLESRYRYSIGIVYNPFPWPSPDTKAKARLEALAQVVLDARAAHPGATLADLYDPDVMPPDLRRAHTRLDAEVDKLYRTAPFASDRERVEHLFALYEGLTADLVSKAKAPIAKPRRRGKKRRLA